MLGIPPAQLEAPGLDTLMSLLTQPGEQARELQAALLEVTRGGGGNPGAAAAAADVAVQVGGSC